ncbi:MAG TPA: phenylalanine--tRNA ligase subunit beta [Actinomycetes bacterium]|nr:phenylalanine--tRNA ligase subunit beta [Actinomycetes bacterium]
MRVPLSWLRELVDLPADVTAREVAERLIAVGLEVETVDHVGAELDGPLVLGRVLTFIEEEHSNGKTVRWCRVDVGEHNEEPSDSAPDERPASDEGRASDERGGRGIVCGARNFAEGDLVVVALPGAVLPGGFAISARKTYGHVSDGMICSPSELGVGDDHDGIWVLHETSGSPGQSAVTALGLRDDVLDIAVTPDRGYALSLRGVARECAAVFEVSFVDPVRQPDDEDGDSWPVQVLEPSGCDRFVIRTVSGLDVTASSPHWLQQRLRLAGMRPISLAVDVTNFVMLEYGQPLHAYDRARLSGPIVVRRAEAGEKLRTLDDAVREMDADDLLITDDSGPIGIAGVMGGASTEIDGDSTDIVIEAAHFDASAIARSARRHKLPSEASRRFARGVDPALQEAAAERAASLLAELGGATIDAGRTVVATESKPVTVAFAPAAASRLIGVEFSESDVAGYLRQIGCHITATGDCLEVTIPTWRPDLTGTAELVEEVARLHGYQHIPSELPNAPASAGLTSRQRLRRRVGLALAGAGYVEVQSYPFLSPQVHDSMGLAPDDDRRRALVLANPLSEEEPELRTTLLPGLFATVRRNVGRGTENVSLFEMGLVYRPTAGDTRHQPPRPVVDRRPTVEELAAIGELLPHQPQRVAVVLAGERDRSGWWGAGREASWGDAVAAARTVAAASGVVLKVVADDHAPWHPGRCAALWAGDTVVGHAGELHPQVTAEFALPERTSAMELDLDLLATHGQTSTRAPHFSTQPVAKEDLALVVDAGVASADVAAALKRGGGNLVESVRLFDVYSGDQLGEGKRSLAFALRLRADDHTLTPDEVASVRADALAEAQRATGATLRV